MLTSRLIIYTNICYFKREACKANIDVCQLIKINIGSLHKLKLRHMQQLIYISKSNNEEEEEETVFHFRNSKHQTAEPKSKSRMQTFYLAITNIGSRVRMKERVWCVHMAHRNLACGLQRNHPYMERGIEGMHLPGVVQSLSCV